MMHDVLILILGFVLGSLLSPVVVHCVLTARRRKQVGRALLADVGECVRAAKSTSHWLVEHLLHGFEKNVFNRQYLNELEAPIWEAALTDSYYLPAQYLTRLIVFHSFRRKINRKIQAYNQEQDRLERVAANTEMSASIVGAMRRIAETTAGMCDEMAKCKSIVSLDDLPCEYRDIYPPVAISEPQK